jgi:hypothetical protein
MGRVDTTRWGWSPLLAALSVLVSLVTFTNPAPAQAAISVDGFEDCLVDRANEARAAVGAPNLEMAYKLVDEVRDWSERMRYNVFEHMPSDRRYDILPDSWTTWGENIAWHSTRNVADCDRMHEMWMSSPGHRKNILNPGFRFVVMGAYADGSGWWGTQLFFDASNYQAACNGTFCDDDGSVFEQSIEIIAGADITEGCNPPVDNRFCPGDRVTRGAMAAFLARALALPPGPSVEFSDTNGSVFEEAIERIAGAGITQGCNPPSNSRFCPSDYVTRGQMAAFLARALDLPASDSIDFSDDDDSIFQSSIEKLAAARITEGCNPPSNTRFCPDDYVTRGQMAAFLARALDL